MKILFSILFNCLLVTSSLAESHHPQEFLKSIQGTKDEGAQIVQHFCASCHAVQPMIELGAPKIAQENDWEFRVKKGLNVLLTHTQEGFNAMPARGGCFECSDKQLVLAILAMVPERWRRTLK